jgi:hypothetical protein
MYSPSEIVDAMGVADIPTRVELDNAMAQQSDGLPPGYAAWSAGMAEASGDKPQAERLRDADAFDARADRMTAGYNAATGMPQPSGLAGADGSRDWSGWQPGDALPERPRMGPTALESARESQAADRNAAIGQKYGPIAQRIAEAGDAAGVTDYAAVQAPRERYKNEERRQLANRRRFEDDSLAKEDLAKAERRQKESNQNFRESVKNADGAQARRDKEQSRLERWQAISMLAGGNPSRQQFATGNALMMLPENERNQSLRYMLPGGQFAAAVDAQNMQNANDVIKRFMTSGAAAGMNNPLANAQAQMAQQQADSAKPVQVRAQEHVASGRLNHPDVLQHADDLVNTHYSSRPGALGVSSRFTDNEVMLAAQRLADDTGMPVAEAEKLMRRIQADRNRNSVASSFVAGFYDQ